MTSSIRTMEMGESGVIPDGRGFCFSFLLPFILRGACFVKDESAWRCYIAIRSKYFINFLLFSGIECHPTRTLFKEQRLGLGPSDLQSVGSFWAYTCIGK